MRHLIELALSALLIAIAVVPASARGTSLKVVSRPDRNQARLAYSSSDAAAGLGKGAGTDPAAIGASIFIAHEHGTTTFTVPAGAFDGTTGWTKNDGMRAEFRNRTAPGGPTGVRSLRVLVGHKMTLDTKSVGDGSPLALTAAPTADITFGSTITNGSETVTHCTRFAPVDCSWQSRDGGTGWKLECRNGVADPSCGAISICGNGIRDHSEECDGGALCTADCHQGLSSCCQGSNACVGAPVFSLLGYLYQYCSAQLGGATPVAGSGCQADGQCADLPIEPVHLCCQYATGCSDNVPPASNPGSSIGQLYYFLYYCNGGAGLGSGPFEVVNATCGPNGTCIPQ
jgi:hypothetical protein